MEKLDQVLFFTLEKSIKTYRQFAQRQIDKANIAITIDQWLVLKPIQDWPDISQHQIAENVFKDYASVTRMIEQNHYDVDSKLHYYFESKIREIVINSSLVK
jgi:MarR family transcriptional regulator, transcriptional regulator for hemolysin